MTLLANVAAARVVTLRREAQLHTTIAFEQLTTQVAIAIASAQGSEPRVALLDTALELTGAQRAFWLSRQAVDAPWQALAAREPRGRNADFQPDLISRTVLGQAVEEREAVCLIETDRPETWTPGQSLLALGIRMVWCLPVGPAGTEAVYIDTSKLDAIDPREMLARLENLLKRFESLLWARQPLR
jgi:hypothetical protein